jgi:hypothetical protein
MKEDANREGDGEIQQASLMSYLHFHLVAEQSGKVLNEARGWHGSAFGMD